MAATRAKKKPVRRRKKSKNNRSGLMKLFSWLLTIVFFFFTLGVLGYVVFFRTVQAQELSAYEESSIIFEEPDPPEHEHDGEAVQLPGYEKPRVAIIIDDMGYHQREGDALLELPYQLTFSFLPFAPFTSDAMETAYQKGKTILLHQPMQPKGLEWNAGEGALLKEQAPEEMRRLMEVNLQRVQYATGVNNHMGSLLTEYPEYMKVVVSYLQENGLFFVDSFTTSKSVGFQLAQERGLKTARRHVFLDNKQNVDKICEQLEKLVLFAEKNGEGIGIGHPYPQTFEALRKCLPAAVTRVKIVGVEQLVR